MNDDEEDRLSSISEIFDPTKETKFIKAYNLQGHYSAS
jgi:hypothetical protein